MTKHIEGSTVVSDNKDAVYIAPHYLLTTPFRRTAALTQKLHRAGYQAWIVGGAVRDMVLGMMPREYDLVSDATPQELQKIFPISKGVGKAFGISLVIYEQHAFEIATFRKERFYDDGRHPRTVHYCRSAQQDVLRRDFTVNGLLCDVRNGQVVDYVNGVEDIRQRIIRTIGTAQKRFAEDRLRILRAIRFATILQFDIEEHTMHAIVKSAHSIDILSWERIRNELFLIITSPFPGRGLQWLHHTGLLAHILPEIHSAMEAEDNEFCRALDYLSKQSANVSDHHKQAEALALLLYQLPGQTQSIQTHATTICNRLRLSRQQRTLIISFITHRTDFASARGMTQAQLKKMIALPQFANHLRLYLVHCLTHQHDLATYHWINQQAVLLKNELHPTPLLNGNDLIAMDYAPSRLLSHILEEVYTQQLEGKLKDKAEAIQFVRNHFPRKGI